MAATATGARTIAAAGVAREDRVAVEALDLMATWLGRFAGDVALILGARAGIYLAGGLAANMVPVLSASRFRDGLLATGKRSDYLGTVPVQVVKTGADAGLKGAAIALSRSLSAAAAPVRRATARTS